MRQKNDEHYANLLSNLRVGKLNEQNLSMLASRMLTSGRRASCNEIVDRYISLVEQGLKPLILTPRTSLCDEINLMKLNQLGSTIYSIEAIDLLDNGIEQRTVAKV
jgi:hypothetical protein